MQSINFMDFSILLSSLLTLLIITVTFLQSKEIILVIQAKELQVSKMSTIY